MWALGFTLNSVTMLALVLMVGIVIDDAIVVLENVFRFVEEKGMRPMDAAREATAEIGLAVLATTLSLVVIFVPVSFMSSIAGRFLYQFGITSAVAILVSLFVSFSLTPMMAARLLRPAAGAGTHAAPASRRGFYAWIDGSYAWMLTWSMRHRLVVAVLGIAAVGASVPLLGSVQREFTPSDVDEAEFSVQVTAPEGLSLPAMDEAMAAVEAELRAVRGVRTTLSTVGGGFLGQVNSGNVYVRIAPHEERTPSISRFVRSLLAGNPSATWEGNYTQADVMTEIDRRLKRLGHLRCQVRNFPSFNIGGGSFDIDFVIRGPVLEDLSAYAEAIRRQSLEAGGFRGLDTSLRLDKPELRVRIDRDRAADLGVRARDIGTALRLLVGGDEEVSRFRDPDASEDYDVRLRLEPSDRDRAELLGLLRLARAGGGTVELSAVADVDPARAPSRIDRIDRQRAVSLRGGVAPGFALADRLEIVRAAAAAQAMPPQYTTQVLGRGREMERTFREFGWAFLLSGVFMYIILAAQFESLLHPVTILLSLPLSVPFALFSLWATGGTLNLYSALGILVLFGVVKKNSILQIDHMNGLIAKGLPRDAAILQANRDRLRPILMTTLALVAGMLPLGLGTGPGAEERRAVAVVVIGGQTLCLLLTLLVTPVAYSLFEDARGLLRRRPA
jgi:HAE1 family hydrophobic/amphiphilic exporter-1